MSDAKIKGKVKWFSIRKGFGFITPSSDNSPTTDDIFFHQTSIVSDVKNKFLEPNYEVEFEVYTDEAGKYKSRNVTQPGGAPCVIPERKNANTRKRGKGGKKDGEEGAKVDGEADGKEKENKNGEGNKNGESGDSANNKGGRPRRNNRGKKEGDSNAEASADKKKPEGAGARGRPAPRKRFDDGISADVKTKMKDKKLDMRQTSLLIVLDKFRIKFGPDGYAALCHADGIMAEGTFTCDDEGKVTLTWKNMLKFEGGEWKTDDPIASTSSGILVSSFSWTDENVSGMKALESPESLWGADKTDPAEALQSNNFQMRKCFLAKAPVNPRNRRRPRNRAGGRGGGGRGGKENTNGKQAAEK